MNPLPLLFIFLAALVAEIVEPGWWVVGAAAATAGVIVNTLLTAREEQ